MEVRTINISGIYPPHTSIPLEDVSYLQMMSMVHLDMSPLDDIEILSRLTRIVSYEKETYRLMSLMRRGRCMPNNGIIDDYVSHGGSVNQIPYEFYMGYSDIYGIDTHLNNREGFMNLCVHISMMDGLYLGHVYTWKESNELHVQGIRTSIRNSLRRIVGRGIRGVGSSLVKNIISLDHHPIIVDLPLESMSSILLKYGFKENEDGDYLLD